MKKYHIQLAHDLWAQCLQENDVVVDATCGNGKDTLFLASLVLERERGRVFSYDIQDVAIQRAQKLLQRHLDRPVLDRVTFLHKSHEDFSDVQNRPVRLIVYNLGYLPGSDKTVFTKLDSTMLSLKRALDLTSYAISITCYPGHDEGEKEAAAIVRFLTTLDKNIFQTVVHQHKEKPRAPFFIWITKVKPS